MIIALDLNIATFTVIKKSSTILCNTIGPTSA